MSKTAINFVWNVNFAKWNTLEKIISHYEKQKKDSSLKSDFSIEDIIPNFGYNKNSWRGNNFFAQNITSWALERKENPVRLFINFSSSCSLISFDHDELKKKFFKKINKQRKIFVFSFFFQISIFLIEKILLTKTFDIKKFLKQEIISPSLILITNSLTFYFFLKNQKNILQKLNNDLKEIKKNSINDFENLNSDQFNKKLEEFIQEKYKTDIKLDYIKSEYIRVMKEFELNIQKYNPNFQVIDIKNFIKENYLEISEENKILNSFLEDKIFQMGDAIDLMKIIVNYYGFGSEKNLTIDMDITSKIFDKQQLEKILSDKIFDEQKKQKVFFGKANNNDMENQICYSASLRSTFFENLFTLINSDFYNKNSEERDFIFQKIKRNRLKILKLDNTNYLNKNHEIISSYVGYINQKEDRKFFDENQKSSWEDQNEKKNQNHYVKFEVLWIQDGININKNPQAQ